MSLTDLRTQYPALTYQLPKLPSAPRLDPSSIVLGRDVKGLPLALPLRARLEHCFIIGATGSGKSTVLLHWMRQGVRNEEGLLFLDPHGGHPNSVYRTLLAWLSERDVKVHVIDLNAPRVMGFNPLACPTGTDPSVIAGNVMDALAITWEGESFTQKPTIERVLTAVIIALVELGLTLCDAPSLLDRLDAQRLRSHAIQKIKDEHTRDELKRLQELAQDGRRKRDYDQETVGPANRLARLLRPPAVRAMLGQTQNTLELKAAMDNGEVVLANLSGGSQVYKRDTDLVGRLLTRTALFEAERRSNTRPFSVILDEAHRFLSSDIPVLLAEVRKYGVSVVAAMQWLEQARTQDENILAALLNVNCKICFRLRDATEAELLARSIVPLNLERPVSTLIKPTVTGHRRIKLANASKGESDARTDSITRGTTEGRSISKGETVAYTHADFESVSDVKTETEMESASSGETEGLGEQAAEILIPTSDPNSPIVSRVTSGASSSSAKSSGGSQGRASNKGKVTSSGTMDSESHAFSTAVTDSLATSYAESSATTHGTNKSEGESEALEPILENLPSAVHSIQNELYAAGLLLRSLPTAVGFCSFVGKRGSISTLFTVPPIISTKLSDDAFNAIRDKYLPAPFVAEAQSSPKQKPQQQVDKHEEHGASW